MRVVVVSLFSPFIERGVEVYADSLVRQLRPRLDIRLISARQPFQPLASTRLSRFGRRFYLDRTSLALKQAMSDVLGQLETQPPDILYPLNNGWTSFLAKRFCLRHSTKLLLAGHAGPGWDDRVNLWLKPDAFLVFSRAQQRWARTVARRADLFRIPHGIDLQQFRPGTSLVRLPLSKPVFLSVAALSASRYGSATAKNTAATIMAVAGLKHGSLLLIGQGQNQTALDRLANSRLGPGRYLRLSLPHRQIADFYRLADVFTLVSARSEAFGLVYLEALASNLPVVATGDPLRREIIGKAGLFVADPRDVPAYSRTLARAAAINWGNLPRRQATPYSFSRIIPSYLELFHRLVPDL